MPGRYVQLVATKLCRIAIDLAGDRMLRLVVAQQGLRASVFGL